MGEVLEQGTVLVLLTCRLEKKFLLVFYLPVALSFSPSGEEDMEIQIDRPANDELRLNYVVETVKTAETVQQRFQQIMLLHKFTVRRDVFS